MATAGRKIKTPNDIAFKQAVEVVAELGKAGFVAYLVGGCVRDCILGFKPKDYDIATNARPEDVRKIYPKARLYGKRFGVSVVPIESGDIEVAAFRQDGFYYDHRRPASVDYAGITEDALRRDFTINALYYDPIADTIVDLVDGRSDLKNRTLKIIGDPFERFDEDWLRLLRAIRFAAHFSLKFDNLTWDGLKALAPMITGISAERCTEEVRLMLQGPHAGRATGLLYNSGLWRALWPNLPFSTKRVRKAVNLLKKTHPKSSVWASFLVDLPENTVNQLSEKIKWTRAEKKTLGIK